jgi:hypothetical protein
MVAESPKVVEKHRELIVAGTARTRAILDQLEMALGAEDVDWNALMDELEEEDRMDAAARERNRSKGGE